MHRLIVPLTSPEAKDANRFGPKAANLAAMGQAGLPIPEGFCLDAEAYRAQVAALGLKEAMASIDSLEPGRARRAALDMKLGLLDRSIVPEIQGPLVAAWRALAERTGARTVVRSSALVEDRFGSSFAGQFESYLGLETEEEFLTAVRSCWAALWSTRVLRYMAGHDASPADTAMAVLIQPLIEARVAGGGLSQTHSGDMVLNATWGLGSAIAQGEVVPERIVLTREGKHRDTALGRKYHRVGCAHSGRPLPRPLFSQPCLNAEQAVELGRILRRAEDLMGMPVEIEWAMDDKGFKLVQARPLHLEPSEAPDDIWSRHPGINGQPAGVGWGSGRARVVNCECELTLVAPGDILVTKVAGPALSEILPRVAGVVAELGGSTSHLASLGRERGIPMVLGVLDATTRIPDGAQVAVDGVAGVVRWIQ
jgi:phosphoenolpyruvate synthase/pyruvate phosphate dikinase